MFLFLNMTSDVRKNDSRFCVLLIKCTGYLILLPFWHEQIWSKGSGLGQVKDIIDVALKAAVGSLVKLNNILVDLQM